MKFTKKKKKKKKNCIKKERWTASYYMKSFNLIATSADILHPTIPTKTTLPT